jgi:hypothetical protein
MGEIAVTGANGRHAKFDAQRRDAEEKVAL